MAWSWRGHGVVVAWSWHGHGVVVAWSWRGRGVVVAWSWRGRGRSVRAEGWTWRWSVQSVGVGGADEEQQKSCAGCLSERRVARPGVWASAPGCVPKGCAQRVRLRFQSRKGLPEHVSALLPLCPGRSAAGAAPCAGKQPNSPVQGWDGSARPHRVSVLLILIANTQVN